jgi:hypothetical protein
MQPEQLSRMFNTDFLIANDAWRAQNDAFPAGHSAFPPISLRVDIVPPSTQFDGCDLRGAKPGKNGVLTCTDALAIEGDSIVFKPDGQEHRVRSLVPVEKGKSANKVDALYLSISSKTNYWQLQEQLIQIIAGSLRAY